MWVGCHQEESLIPCERRQPGGDARGHVLGNVGADVEEGLEAPPGVGDVLEDGEVRGQLCQHQLADTEGADGGGVGSGEAARGERGQKGAQCGAGGGR